MIDDLPPASEAARQSIPSRNNGAILVATNGTDRCSDALAWAVAEAATRRCMLRIVHVVDWPAMTADAFGAPPVDRLAEAASAGEAILEQAAELAHDMAPEVELVRQLEVDRSASAAILRAAGNDTLIVLGRREGRRFRRYAHSTAAQVARRSDCPVAVIGLHGETTSRPRRSAGIATGQVTAIVESHPGSLRALDFALRAAEGRGIDVTVLRVRDPGTQQFEDAFSERVRPAAKPGAPRISVQDRSLATAVRLVADAAGAALVVLSDETPRSIRRALFGRVGRPAKRSSLGPVVLVRKEA